MSVEVLQISTQDLRVMVDEMVEEKLAALLNDPDDDFEITDELRERLLRQRKNVANGEFGEAFEDVVTRLGLN